MKSTARCFHSPTFNEKVFRGKVFAWGTFLILISEWEVADEAASSEEDNKRSVRKSNKVFSFDNKNNNSEGAILRFWKFFHFQPSRDLWELRKLNQLLSWRGRASAIWCLSRKRIGGSTSQSSKFTFLRGQKCILMLSARGAKEVRRNRASHKMLNAHPLAFPFCFLCKVKNLFKLANFTKFQYWLSLIRLQLLLHANLGDFAFSICTDLPSRRVRTEQRKKRDERRWDAERNLCLSNMKIWNERKSGEEFVSRSINNFSNFRISLLSPEAHMRYHSIAPFWVSLIINSRWRLRRLPSNKQIYAHFLIQFTLANIFPPSLRILQWREMKSETKPQPCGRVWTANLKFHFKASCTSRHEQGVEKKVVAWMKFIHSCVPSVCLRGHRKQSARVERDGKSRLWHIFLLLRSEI